MNDSICNSNTPTPAGAVTALIKNVECVYFHPQPEEASALPEPFMRLHATVVKDNAGRFDPGNWIITSQVLHVGRHCSGTDFITRSGSRYRTDETEYSHHHFYMTPDVIKLFLAGVSAKVIREMKPDAVISGTCAH